MKILFFVLYILSFLTTTLWGQSIYPCRAVTETGEPIDYQLEWNINPKGEFINILLQNDHKPFEDEFLYILIDRKKDDSYIPYDSKAYHVDSSATWLVHNYQLTEPGDYLIYFVNSTQRRIAEQKITVNYINSYSSAETENRDIYYDNCQMVFCDRIVSGKPHKIIKETKLRNGRAAVYVYINNYKPLRTNKISVIVSRKDFQGFEFDEKVGSKSFKIDALWSDAFFNYAFNKSGEYKLAIYNEKDILMKFNFIKVY